MKSAAQRTGEKTLPGFAADGRVDAAIDERETVAVGDEIDVDVIEPERQRETDPEQAGRDLDRPTRLGRRRIGEGQ